MGTSARNLMFSAIVFGLVAGVADISNKAMAMFRAPQATPPNSARRRRSGRATTAASQRRAAKKLRVARARAPKRKA